MTSYFCGFVDYVVEDFYDSQRAMWGNALFDLNPKVKFPPSEMSIVGKNAPEGLQDKVNEIMKGIIPCLHLSDASEKKDGKLPDKFHLLQAKPCVFWHEEIPEYVFKNVGTLIPSIKVAHLLSDKHTEDRVPMANALRKIVIEKNLDRLYVVKKYLLQLPRETWERKVVQDYFFRKPINPIKEVQSRKDLATWEGSYVVAAERMDLTDVVKTKKMISEMDKKSQKVLLRQLFELFYLSGYQDGHFWNFAFANTGPQKGKLIIYDTESTGLVEEHQKAEKKCYSLGNIRRLDMDCGEHAMKEVMKTDRGLPFDEDVKNEVYQEFKSKLKAERDHHFRANFILYVLPLLPIVASIWFQQCSE